MNYVIGLTVSLAVVDTCTVITRTHVWLGVSHLSEFLSLRPGDIAKDDYLCYSKFY